MSLFEAKKIVCGVIEGWCHYFRDRKHWFWWLLFVSLVFNLFGLLSLAYDPCYEYHVVELNPPPWATSYGLLVPEGSSHQPPILMRVIPESGLFLVPSELNATSCTLRIRYSGRLDDGAHVEKIIVTTYQLGDETRLGVGFTP